MLEDGFSHLQNVKSSNSQENSSQLSGGGQIGVSNVFAFLGISIKGDKASSLKSGATNEIQQEKIHTPNSLFNKMRDSLTQKGVVITSNFLTCKPGQFVELDLSLTKNPIIDSLESSLSLMKLISNISGASNSSKNNKTNKMPINEISSFLLQMKTEGSLDLIGNNIGEEKFKAVLTIDRAYLNDPSLSDIADGEFKVLGKVIKVIPKNGEINLLRKTSLGKIQPDLFNQMFSGFSELESHGIKNMDLSPEVKAPVIQIIPIAIFA